MECPRGVGGQERAAMDRCWHCTGEYPPTSRRKRKGACMSYLFSTFARTSIQEKPSLDLPVAGTSSSGSAGGSKANGDEKEANIIDDDSSLPTPLGNVTNFSAARQIPTISITKPPAPMPVDLPSPSTLTPDDEVGGSSFPLQHDIEGIPAVQGVVSDVPLTAVPPRKARSRSPSPKLTLDTAPGLSDSPDAIPINVEEPLAVTVPDLLVDDTTLAGPSQTEGAGSSGTDSPVLIDAADVSSMQDPDTTIRLVGGGGVSGVTEDPLQADGVLVDEPELERAADSDAAEVASIKSVDSKTSTASKKHGRKKSSVSLGLKKLGQLGGKRRTDSVTSVDSKQ